MKPTISQSRINSWNSCRMKHHLKYNEKLRRRRVSRPLTFGSTVHKVIEFDADRSVKNTQRAIDLWTEGEIKKSRLFTEEADMFREIKNEAMEVMREYHDFWPKGHLRPLRVKGKRAEHEFHYEVPGEDFIFHGLVDQYAKSQNGLKWLVEHKSGKNLMGAEDRWRSIQAALYITIGRELGWPDADGICWDLVRSKTPTRPQLLKNGTFSLKRIDTLPSVVYNTIEAAGQDPNDYPTLLANAEQSRSNWFQRPFQPVSEGVRSYLYTEMVESARGILDNPTSCAMNIGRHCSWCDFEPICRARMEGSDEDFVKEREYATRPEKTEAKPRRKKVRSKTARPRRIVKKRKLTANKKG